MFATSLETFSCIIIFLNTPSGVKTGIAHGIISNPNIFLPADVSLLRYHAGKLINCFNVIMVIKFDNHPGMVMVMRAFQNQQTKMHLLLTIALKH